MIGDTAFYHACIWGIMITQAIRRIIYSRRISEEAERCSRFGDLNDTNYAHAEWIVFVLFQVKHRRTGSLMTGFMLAESESRASLRRGSLKKGCKEKKVTERG